MNNRCSVSSKFAINFFKKEIQCDLKLDVFDNSSTNHLEPKFRTLGTSI